MTVSRALLLGLLLPSLAACAGGGRATPAPSPTPSGATAPGGAPNTPPPSPIPSAAPAAAGGEAPAPEPAAGGDTAVVESMARTRAGELRTCYEQNGLKLNPSLAGDVTLLLTVGADGTVRGATVGERTWSGPGVAESESCFVAHARQWRFPALASGGQFPLAFHFTR